MNNQMKELINEIREIRREYELRFIYNSIFLLCFIVAIAIPLWAIANKSLD